ncbi:MAG TPA: hypothetical protein DCP92_09720 [Nitrospiraceae bacterium]|jgi:lipopolysaccharide assembly outer membrane protein LptD (OstA)|nr:hypothetical protein [Nitrospiraceae bacterium]
MADWDVREMENKDLEFIEAEFVTIKQSTVRAVEGGHVELQQVGALSIDGERIEMAQSASTIIRGGDVSLNQSMSILTVGNTANLQYSFSPLCLSGEHTSVSGSAVGVVGAKTLKVENTAALIVIANNVQGEVTTLLDWRSALAVGAVVGGVLGIISIFKRQ